MSSNIQNFVAEIEAQNPEALVRFRRLVRMAQAGNRPAQACLAQTLGILRAHRTMVAAGFAPVALFTGPVSSVAKLGAKALAGTGNVISHAAALTGNLLAHAGNLAAKPFHWSGAKLAGAGVKIQALPAHVHIP